MSDAESISDSISDSSNAHVDVDAGDEALISVSVRRLCNRLRANDPRLLDDRHDDDVFDPSHHMQGYSEAEIIEVFQALKENTSVKNVALSLNDYTKSTAEAAADYLESSKTLQTLELWVNEVERSQEIREMISVLLRALSRKTSVTKLIIDREVVRFASVAFQELLTRTQTLQKLAIFGYEEFEVDEVQRAAIISGFANNTTLRNLELDSWREANLAPVLTALQDHPALQKIQLSGESSGYLPSLSGLEVLLSSQIRKSRN
jgi:hypothetical protein